MINYILIFYFLILPCIFILVYQIYIYISFKKNMYTNMNVLNNIIENMNTESNKSIKSNKSKKIKNGKYLFCYGSNSIEQIKERLNIERDIVYHAAFINNYTRIFCGISKKWDNGGISSIYPLLENKVFGISVYLSEDEIKRLDEHESGYTRMQLEGNIQYLINKKSKKKIFEVYIKNNNNFRQLPSENYMKAILKMIRCRDSFKEKEYQMDENDTIDENLYKRILIKIFINKTILKIGYWTENGGFHLYDHIN